MEKDTNQIETRTSWMIFHPDETIMLGSQHYSRKSCLEWANRDSCHKDGYRCKKVEVTYKELENVKYRRMKTGIELIEEERKRQIEVEMFDEAHDSANATGELANAASCYAMEPCIRPAELPPCHWPWLDFWKPTPDNRIKELIKAGALIAAEIDRLQNDKLTNDER